MKKIKTYLSLLMVLALVFTGCSSNKTMDLDKVREDLLNLKGEEFSPNSLYELDLKEYFGETEDVYNPSVYGIEYEDLDYFVSVKSVENDYFYVVVKPMEEKHDSIKKALDNYVSKLDSKLLTKKEYQDHLVYIYCKDSSKVFEKFKEARLNVLPAMMDADIDIISTTLDVEEAWLDEYMMFQPMMLVNSSTIIIVKPSVGNIEKVEDKIEEYFITLEEQWKRYLPDQYELVKNRMQDKIGDYLVYIVSTNNDAVFKTIKKAVK